jgi:hypothetical protein
VSCCSVTRPQLEARGLGRQLYWLVRPHVIGGEVIWREVVFEVFSSFTRPHQISMMQAFYRVFSAFEVDVEMEKIA